MSTSVHVFKDAFNSCIKNPLPESRAMLWETLGHVYIDAGLLAPVQKAMFMAQIHHESGGFRYTHEIWGPTPAQKRYEDRKDLGNTRPGDGYKYRGRGLIQITGRRNYTVYGQAIHQDLVGDPDKAGEDENAVLIAVQFWRANNLALLADDIRAVTRRINGGYNGLEERKALFGKYSDFFAKNK